MGGRYRPEDRRSQPRWAVVLARRCKGRTLTRSRDRTLRCSHELEQRRNIDGSAKDRRWTRGIKQEVATGSEGFVQY